MTKPLLVQWECFILRCIQAKVFRQDRGVRVDFDHIKISHGSSEVIFFIKYRDQFPPDRTQAFQNDTVGQVIGLKTSCQFHHLLQAGFFFQLVDFRNPFTKGSKKLQNVKGFQSTNWLVRLWQKNCPLLWLKSILKKGQREEVVKDSTKQFQR